MCIAPNSKEKRWVCRYEEKKLDKCLTYNDSKELDKKEHTMICTDFLFAMPSFVGGMASVLDLGATLTVYNECRTGEEADARAMACDWRVVGEDIRLALDRLRKEVHGQGKT